MWNHFLKQIKGKVRWSRSGIQLTLFSFSHSLCSIEEHSLKAIAPDQGFLKRVLQNSSLIRCFVEKKKSHGQIHLANWMSYLCLEICGCLLADKESETSWKGVKSLLICNFPQFLLDELCSTVEYHRAMKIDKWLLHMDTSYKYDAKWKKPDTTAFILHESIYIQLNNRQKYPMDLKVRMSLSIGVEVVPGTGHN